MEDYFKQLTGVIGMRIKLKFTLLRLVLKHLDNTALSQLTLENFGINITKYMDYKNEMLIKIENFYISELQDKMKQYFNFTPQNFDFKDDIKVNSENYVVMPIIYID